MVKAKPLANGPKTRKVTAGNLTPAQSKVYPDTALEGLAFNPVSKVTLSEPMTAVANEFPVNPLKNIKVITTNPSEISVLTSSLNTDNVSSSTAQQPVSGLTTFPVSESSFQLRNLFR